MIPQNVFRWSDGKQKRYAMIPCLVGDFDSPKVNKGRHRNSLLNYRPQDKMEQGIMIVERSSE